MSLAGLLAIVAWRPASACRCRRIRGGLQTGVEPRSIAWYALVVLERDGQVKIGFNGVRRHGRCSCRRLSMPTGGSVPEMRQTGSLFPPFCAGEPISACLRPDRTNPILSASDGLVENAGTRTDLYLRKFTDMFNIFYILRLIIGRIGWRNDRMGLQ